MSSEVLDRSLVLDAVRVTEIAAIAAWKLVGRGDEKEALAGVTRHASRALGLADRGTLAPGMRADVALWDIAEPAELAYRIGCDACAAVFRAGRLVRGTP